MMFQVGLTGGIGSGKTLVCSVLEKLGVAVYYADIEARNLMGTNQDLMDQIKVLFGREAYKDGVLNREYLAGKVFRNPVMLAKLNDLVHPAVGEDYSRWLEFQTNVPYVVEEAAILFESGGDRKMDFTVLVFADEELRIQRVIQRDGLDRDQVLSRMRNQMDEEEKMKQANYIIYNDEREMLLPQIVRMHHAILKKR